jgi:hypothetical protein
VSEQTTPPRPEFWIGVLLQRESPEKKESESEKKAEFWPTAAKTLAAGYVFVGFILTTVGEFQGGLERLLLNHPKLTLAGLLLVGAGIGLAFVAGFVKGAGQKRVVRYSALFFALGLVCLWQASTMSLSEAERPEIATTASMTADGSKLEGHVSAFGVKTKQWIYVSAKGLANAQTEDGVSLYKTRAGPGRDGKVDLTFAIPVAFNRYQRVRVGAARVGAIDQEKNDPCFEDPENQPPASDAKKPEPVKNQSCATVFPPTGPKRPTLSASWEKSGTDTNVISVTVKTSGVNPDDVVLLDMAGNSRQGKPRAIKRVIFYRSMFSGSPTGTVDVTAKAPMPNGMTRACVVATTISMADSTPLQGQPTRVCALGLLDLSRTSFAVITVPRTTTQQPKTATQQSSPSH